MPIVRRYTLAVWFGILSTYVPILVGANRDLGDLSGVKPLPVGQGPMPVQLGKHRAQLSVARTSEHALERTNCIVAQGRFALPAIRHSARPYSERYSRHIGR